MYDVSAFRVSRFYIEERDFGPIFQNNDDFGKRGFYRLRTDGQDRAYNSTFFIRKALKKTYKNSLTLAAAVPKLQIVELLEY